jgi:hypothetical protein
MAWEINQLSVDYKGNRGTVTLTKQPDPATPNDYQAVNVNFGVADDDQQKEGNAEAHLKARAKQILIDAANSL